MAKKTEYKKAPRQGIEPWFSDLKSDVLTIERSRRFNINDRMFIKFVLLTRKDYDNNDIYKGKSYRFNQIFNLLTF